MAYIATSGVTGNSITVYLDGLDPNYSLYDRQAYWGIGLDSMSVQWVGQSSVPAYVTSGGSYTFMGLTGSTTYIIMCYVTTNMGTVWMNDIYVTTAAVRPPYFSWTYQKVSGGYFNLTAAEWNAFTANINAVRQYKGLPTYWFTTAYTGQPFTAIHYNEVVYAIQGISGYGYWITTHNQGDVIMASYLNTAVSEINAVP